MEHRNVDVMYWKEDSSCLSLHLFCRHENAMAAYEETVDAKMGKEEEEQEPQYPKEVHFNLSSHRLSLSALRISKLYNCAATVHCVYFIALNLLHRGDKVSMLTHTYPHKPMSKIKVVICNHQADCPFYLQPDF